MDLLVLGAGESGVGAALLGVKLGYNVRVSDKGKVKETYKDVLNKAGIFWEENGHSKSGIGQPDLVVKSPGIPGHIPLIKDLKADGAEVISEVEFASRHTSGKIVAITGTNGKTTTTSLIYHIFEKAGLDVAIVGNIGQSFAGAVAERDRDVYVVEVSSFQLDDIVHFKPYIAVLLNITPDHLDRYKGEFDNYIDAKYRMTINQDGEDHFIFWDDDPVIQKGNESRDIKAQFHPYSLNHPVREGAHLEEENIVVNLTNKPFEMSIHELALQGKHNTSNSMAASVAARIFEIRKEIVRESLSDFQNVEHRLEFVATIHGIKFINDSKATNVNSTWYALESISEPIVWIVGGVDKGNDYSMLEPLVREKVKAIICLGKDNKKVKDYFSPMVEFIEEASTADEAVNLGYRFGTKGDVVLLSPACASFDLFENYEQRGHQFKRAIRAL